MGLFIRPKSQQSPSNKEFSYKLNFLHNGRPNARSRSNSSLCGGRSRLMWSTNCSRPLFYTTWVTTRPLQKSTTVKYLTSHIALQGLLLRLLAPNWEINNIEYHPHTRLSLGLGSDTNWMTWGFHPKRLTFWDGAPSLISGNWEKNIATVLL